MFDLSEVLTAAKKPGSRTGSSAPCRERCLLEAHEMFRLFRQDNEISMLRQSMEKFADALRYSRNNPEAYFHLAIGFYIIGKPVMAREYLGIVKSLQPDYPGLEKFLKIVG